ncbi:MAG: hypothetical protein K0U70_02900 [Actinomycetia bacterium]|nr:hypothetical protein [Actinomycetes bacterium]
MSTDKPLRKISDPLVAAGPSGCRFRTRMHLSDTEAAALVEIGEFLGGCYRRELAGRVRLGRIDRGGHKQWRATRKQALTSVSSSRWAGAITRAVEDQYQLGMRGLAAHVADLHSAVDVLEKRCSLRPGELADDAGDSRRGKRKRGYATASERFAKTRRLAILQQRLVVAEEELAAGRPSITMGGKRLWRNRANLTAAEMDEQQWRDRWDAARMFLTADGETGKTGGNETIRVDSQGRLQLKVPAALVGKFGGHLQFAARVGFAHGGSEWAARVEQRKAVRYDIVFDPQRGRWYLDASWAITPEPSLELEELRGGRVLGVDLNADHLAACVLDSSGNPVGEPVTIALEVKKLRASHRDGHLRAAITEMLNVAELNDCVAVAVENLNFADSRATGRETLGRGGRGKQFRRIVAGIPTAKFRDRLTAMATRRGIPIIGVDPAYTSKWGDEHWRKPLQQQTSGEVTRHHGAAAAIGRRGLGKPIRRRPAGPRTQQRMGVGTPPARPVRIPRSQGVRKAPVHRRAHEACRSTGQRRSPAAKTVRAATEQNSLLLSD